MRRSWPTPHGLPCTSMPLKAVVASCGKSDSIITRLCRRPMRSPGHGVDEDGARLDAGGAGGARPELVDVDLPVHRQVGAVGAHDARLRAVDLELRDEGRLRLEGRLLLGLPRERAALRVAEPQDVRRRCGRAG